MLEPADTWINAMTKCKDNDSVLSDFMSKISPNLKENNELWLPYYKVYTPWLELVGE